jgi:MarR family transcriptional regulator, negative regulator of the multidrug operon emrRAB
MPQAHISGDANAIAAMALLVADRARDAAEAAAGSRGAVAPALCALHEFAAGRPIEVLAGALGVSHSRAVRVVDALVQRGLARRRRAAGDARAVHVELTAAGAAAAQRVLAARARAVEAVLGALDAGERAQLAALAGRVFDGPVTGRAAARRICRFCDAHACGHDAGRCPVTLAADRALRIKGTVP